MYLGRDDLGENDHGEGGERLGAKRQREEIVLARTVYASKSATFLGEGENNYFGKINTIQCFIAFYIILFHFQIIIK